MIDSVPHGNGCDGHCQTGPGFPFSMAYQPIVDTHTGQVWAYEALVRGPQGESAASILGRVDADNRYAFDQACRVQALRTAAGLGLGCRLSINFLPNAVYEPAACIRTTLRTAQSLALPTDRIIFEVTEGEKVLDRAHLQAIFTEYARLGFLIAIDDFGAGYSGLNLLAEFQPDIIKLDMELTRGVDANPARRAIVRGVLCVCEELDILPIAEGVETLDEAKALRDLGVGLMQGYLFARPGFESLPVPQPVFSASEPLAITAASS